MKYRLSGVSTPFGGLSWDKSISSKDYFDWLFTFLGSKRILTNPIEMECKALCVKSVEDIKDTLAHYPINLRLSTEDKDTINALIESCKTYLNSLNSVENEGIIYKNGDHWADFTFDHSMKTFRESFKKAIVELEKRHKIDFAKNIPEKY